MNNSPGISNLTSLKLNSSCLSTSTYFCSYLSLQLQSVPPQTSLSKSMASQTILQKPEDIWSSLTQSFPSPATCNPSASLPLSFIHICHPSLLSTSTITFLINHHDTSPKLWQLLQVS